MLLAAVMGALEAFGQTQDDLGAVAVATGPGSFSGLRVGMGIAKGLALGLAIPIVGVPTLADHCGALPVMTGTRSARSSPAGRGRFAYALFADAISVAARIHRSQRTGQRRRSARLLAAYPAVIVCGEFDDATATEISRRRAGRDHPACRRAGASAGGIGSPGIAAHTSGRKR